MKSAILFLLTIVPHHILAATLTIAVSSNFGHTARHLAHAFQNQSNHQVRLSLSSTGKHYAQIIRGAPFDIFLAADAKHPQKLQRKGIGTTRFTYALGNLALWSATPLSFPSYAAALQQGSFDHLAIANPNLAPYGLATQQVLQKMNIWETLRSKLAYAENISQSYQFVASKAAALGFVALSHLKQRPHTGTYWLIPSNQHQPIEQQALLLNNTQAAKHFMQFLQSSTAQKIIQSAGYNTP